MARLALITGAGAPDGIGFAAARLLAGAGHRIAMVATTSRIHDRAAELVAEGFDATGHVVDLTDRAAVQTLIAALGPVEILVNNAGMGTVTEPARVRKFANMADTDWDRDIAVSLTTAYNVTHAVLPGMMARGFGRVVMVSSVTGPLVSNPGTAGYSAAKAGMIGLTHALALEAGPHGVTVNAVLPGWIATGAATKAELRAARHTPPGRAGTPEEVAACIAFLASDAASYVNGASLVVDGGNILQEAKGR